VRGYEGSPLHSSFSVSTLEFLTSSRPIRASIPRASAICTAASCPVCPALSPDPSLASFRQESRTLELLRRERKGRRKGGKQGWEEGMSESVFVFGSLLTLLEFMCSEVLVV
jgi:hypothetical protein